jgi:two-component system, sporulation sensor kinase E
MPATRGGCHHGHRRKDLAWAAQHAEAAVVVLDSQGRVLAANPHAETLALVPLRPYTFFWRAYCQRGSRMRMRSSIRKLSTSGISTDLESRLAGPRHMRWRLSCGRGHGSTLIVAIGTDDTREWQIAQERGASLEALFALSAGMPDPIFIKDEEGRWSHINEAARQLFDLDGIDYHGKSEEDLAEIVAFYADALRTCRLTDRKAWNKRNLSRCEEHISKPDGSLRILETFKIPLFYPDGRPKTLVVLGHDITSRRRAESALASSERHLRAILEATQDALLVTDVAGRLVFVNPPMQQMLGCKEGASLAAQAPHAASWRVTMPGGNTAALGELCGPAAQRLRAPIAGLELEVPDRGSGTAEVFSVSMAPLSPPCEGVVLAAHNITLHAELERTKAEFLQTAAHELRTPLTALQVGLDRCERRLAANQPVPSAVVNRMQAQVGRLTDIMNTLIEVTQLEGVGAARELRVVNVTQIVHDMVSRYRQEAPHRVLTLEGSHEACYAMSDAGSVERVLGHLLDNALRYSPGEIHVSVGADIASVHVAVVDAGPGISRRHWPRLFTQMPSMAERTHSRQGLGVSLYICRRVIHMLGGSIDAEPAPGRGTRFHFSLPLWHAAPERKPTEQSLFGSR